MKRCWVIWHSFQFCPRYGTVTGLMAVIAICHPPCLALTMIEQLGALVIPGGTSPQEAVAFPALAGKPVYLEFILWTPRGVASTRFREIALTSRCSAHGPCFFHLLKKNRDIKSWTRAGRESSASRRKVGPFNLSTSGFRAETNGLFHCTGNCHHS